MSHHISTQRKLRLSVLRAAVCFTEECIGSVSWQSRLQNMRRLLCWRPRRTGGERGRRWRRSLSTSRTRIALDLERGFVDGVLCRTSAVFIMLYDHTIVMEAFNLSFLLVQLLYFTHTRVLWLKHMDIWKRDGLHSCIGLTGNHGSTIWNRAILNPCCTFLSLFLYRLFRFMFWVEPLQILHLGNKLKCFFLTCLTFMCY